MGYLTDDDIRSIEDPAKLEALIDEEIEKWHKEQIDPSGVQVNGFALDLQVFAMRDFLIEQEIIDREDFRIFLLRRNLITLRQKRKEIVPEVRKARIASGVLPPIQGIIGPNGSIISREEVDGSDN